MGGGAVKVGKLPKAGPKASKYSAVPLSLVGQLTKLSVASAIVYGVALSRELFNE